ncbi:MAG TPA: L,D-transpeptidase family protein [Anaerolineales bacterium]|nr:L,D-transpeptidase family protein [Anaerolineales bacterium]
MAELTNNRKRNRLVDQILKNSTALIESSTLKTLVKSQDQQSKFMHLVAGKERLRSNNKEKKNVFRSFFLFFLVLIAVMVVVNFIFTSNAFNRILSEFHFDTLPQGAQQYFWAGVNIPKPTESITQVPVELSENIPETPQPVSATLPATEVTPDPTQITDTPPTVTFDGAYVVQNGDTLFKIATKYGTSVNAIAQNNSISNQSIIYQGQELLIPPSDYVPAVVEPPQNDGIPPEGNDQYILVDISEQHLYAYESGELAFSFVASTGINNSTRVGVFSVLDKISNAYGANWDIWMPNWLGIYWSGTLENGIHALPILSNGNRLWSGYLGTPISYGCVVLGVNESQLLYDWVRVGTVVEIQW